MALAIIALTLLFIDCGGSGSNKSGLKKNEFLGNLPALYADFILAQQAHKAKEEKARGLSDFEKIMLEFIKLEKEEEEMNAKFKALIEAEYARGAGAEVPFTFSEALHNSTPRYRIEKTGFNKSGNFCLNLFAIKINTNIIGTRTLDFGYRFVAKDGSTIFADYFTLYGPELNGVKAFCIMSHLPSNPEHFVDFASVEFITEEEVKQYRREARIK